MTDLWQDIQQKLKDLLGGWASYAALGSFSLYVLGYLAVRFHLTALGMGTDLAVLDERYVFAGAKFVVYFLSNLPIVILFALVLAFLLVVLRFIIKQSLNLLRVIARKVFDFPSKSDKKSSPGLLEKLKEFPTPNRAAFLGIAISVLMIQTVMRKSFWFSNILLEGMPDSDIWLEHLLRPDSEPVKIFYFVGLLGGTMLCTAIWLYARSLPGQDSLSKYLLVVFASVLIIQFLFLPIWYGVFVMDKSIPRVLDLGDQVSLAKNQKAWLIWEGNQGSTYLVHETDCSGPAQKDVSVPVQGVSSPSPTVQSGTANPQLPANASASPIPAPSNSTENINANITVGTNAAAAQTSAPAPATPLAKLCTPVTTLPSDGIIRKLVTLPKNDSKRIQILGYDSIATLSFTR